MKQKPRWTLEMLTASLAVLCGLLVLVLLIQRPTAWLALLALVVLWGVVVVLFRCQLRKWVARWMCGGSFEGSKLQFSLEPLSQPAALLSGETVLWYNAQFRTRLLNGQDALVNRVQKVLPGLDLQQCRKQEGQLLTLADGMWSVHSSTVPGDAESMTLLVLNEETALRKVEAEYKASRPGYLVFLVDGYDDVFGDMLDSERARLLEGINRTLEDMIGRGSGFLRRVASGRYIAVVEERQMEQFANRGYDVLDKIRALDPSVNLSLSIGIGRGAKTLREAQDAKLLLQICRDPALLCGCARRREDYKHLFCPNGLFCPGQCDLQFHLCTKAPLTFCAKIRFQPFLRSLQERCLRTLDADRCRSSRRYTFQFQLHLRGQPEQDH